MSCTFWIMLKISTSWSSLFSFQCSDFGFTFYVTVYVITTMFDDVLFCFRWVVFWGFAKKGYTSLFLRQKGAHLKNVWTICNKHSMISHCSPSWRKSTGGIPPRVYSAQQVPLFGSRDYPFLANERDISKRAVLPGSTTARLFCRSAMT